MLSSSQQITLCDLQEQHSAPEATAYYVVRAAGEPSVTCNIKNSAALDVHNFQNPALTNVYPQQGALYQNTVHLQRVL